VQIIGRSSGRSATGAAAYRAGEKLRSVAHASYQSGEKLQGKSNKGDKNGRITHDYRSKGGVLYKEILLPEGAPLEFMNRQTLWNTVELSEKRKDAQLAREIIVALPKELNLFEQVEILRVYSQENFVRIGMCADFAIHNTGKGNPHAHIMLTTRHVTPKGFGKKNTDWNKKQLLLEWREAWANINNHMFELKGLDEHIDHRSYKEQGINRLPYIHLGHEATALEKKGIKTAKGDYNREIKRINDERTANIYDAQKTDQEIRDHNMPRLLDKEQTMLERQSNEHHENITQLDNREESIDEGIRNINTLHYRIAELKLERKKRHFWEIKRKRELDREIKKAEEKLQTAQSYFWLEHNITPAETPQEIKRIQNQRNLETAAIKTNKTRITEITRTLNAIKAEERAQEQRAARTTQYEMPEIYDMYDMYDRTPTKTKNRNRPIYR